MKENIPSKLNFTLEHILIGAWLDLHNFFFVICNVYAAHYLYFLPYFYVSTKTNHLFYN